MDKFNGAYFEGKAARSAEVAEKLAAVYRHENSRSPWLVYNMNYWLDGERPEVIPDDYFTDPAVMTGFQADRMKAHMERYEDDFIPFLFPWYGTGVLPSAMGVEVHFHPKQDPSPGMPSIKELADIEKLSKPDPYKDGLMPDVLNCIDFMRKHTDLPISATDSQGPLTTALHLCGVENMFVWMCNYPDEAHRVMEFCSDVLIDWITVQKKHAGQSVDSGAWPHGILLPEGFGGLWLADDDITQLPEDLYREFVVPYNSKVLKAFGGGTIHFCGSARHQLDNQLVIEGLTGVNNFCMGDFEQVHMMQEKFEDKAALMICDFMPLEVEAYYEELLAGLKAKGTIVSSYFAPTYALHKGSYERADRDSLEVSDRVFKVFKELLS
jgi:uroporphyrinogen decarboxylase